jgi:hypothetical protein
MSEEFHGRVGPLDANLELRSRLLLVLKPDLDPPQQIGHSSVGTRKIVPVTGGSFQGPQLSGRILPGGADWAVTRADDVLELDVRLTLETTDNALILMCYSGLRHGPPEVLARLGREEVDPDDYYFRIVPTFETAAPQYAHLNRLVAVGLGDRTPHGPVYTVFEIL